MPEHERCIRRDAPELAIAWPLQGDPVFSGKDAAGLSFLKTVLPEFRLG
jgi:dTDP-4-dehydrorhamnose 3,5-epimerase